jgi:YYY domain-containing protein
MLPVDWFNLSALWYLQTLVATLTLAPFALWLFRNSTDRGASVARPLSLLLLIWPAWYLAGIGSGLVPFGVAALWVTIVVLGASGWFLAARASLIDRVTLQHLAIAEAGFLVCFALFIWLHGYGPDITSQEKNSDLMMLSSAMRADAMPPMDSWLSGHEINYYYLGYVIFGSVGRMVGAQPGEAFNLALATIFGMTVVAVAGLAGNIIGKWSGMMLARIAGVLAVGFVVVSGNPWAAFTWMNDRDNQWNMSFFGDSIGWNATRILPSGTDYNAISEFPAFSFVLADLHPHLMALPYAIVALAVAWMFLTLPNSDLVREHWPRLAFAGGVIGSLYALNAWDFPTYLLVGILALLWGSAMRSARERTVAVGVVVVASLVAWLPFYVNFKAPTRQGTSSLADTLAEIPAIGRLLASISGYSGERSTFGHYLSIFGFVWAIAIVLIAVEFYRRRELPYDTAVQNLILGAGAIFLLGGLLIPAPVLVAAGLPVIAILLLYERDHSVSLANVALGLFGLGFALTIIPEFFFLLDIFGNRMNTIFKLYYQIWLLTGLASALAVVSVAQSARQVPIMRYAVALGAAATLALGSVFPVVAGHQWLEWRSPDREWVGINGLEYLELSDPGEYAAIDWLWDNGTPEDVMLAAGGCDWEDELGRPAAGSGVPTIIGWRGHEDQWHLGDDEFATEFSERNLAVQQLYETLDPTLLDQYGVTLLFIGSPEVNGIRGVSGLVPTDSGCSPGPFPNASDSAWPGAGWTEVFNQDDVRIYKRDGS